jgi:hypothetical protein
MTWYGSIRTFVPFLSAVKIYLAFSYKCRVQSTCVISGIMLVIALTNYQLWQITIRQFYLYVMKKRLKVSKSLLSWIFIGPKNTRCWHDRSLSTKTCLKHETVTCILQGINVLSTRKTAYPLQQIFLMPVNLLFGIEHDARRSSICSYNGANEIVIFCHRVLYLSNMICIIVLAPSTFSEFSLSRFCHVFVACLWVVSNRRSYLLVCFFLVSLSSYFVHNKSFCVFVRITMRSW